MLAQVKASRFTEYNSKHSMYIKSSTVRVCICVVYLLSECVFVLCIYCQSVYLCCVSTVRVCICVVYCARICTIILTA